jgi:hypothetical protein
MAYSAGNTILDDHYNGFISDLNTIWGTGSGNSGYGQGSLLSSTSAGATVTATQWETMMSRLEAIGSHQATTGVDHGTISAGNTISAIADLAGDITTVTTKRGNAATVGSTTSASSNRTGSWNGCLTFTATVDFASHNQARYFFNAGGKVSIDFSNQGGGSGNKDTAWGNLIAASGPVYFTSAGPSGPASTVVIAGTSYQGTDHKGTGSPTTETNKGFHDLTSSYQELFKQLDTTYDYTTNFVSINMKYDSGTAKITFLIRCQDTQVGWEHNPTLANPTQRDELVNLNIQCDLVLRPSNITNTWGTPTLAVSNTATTGTGYTC